MTPLRDVYDELVDLAQDRVAAAAFGPPAAEAGGLYDDLTDAFEGLALCNLLLAFDLDRYRTDLVLSAYARRHFLRLCRADGAAPAERALSRTGALFCALAARHDVLAAEVVRLGPAAWVPDGEYEDDFLYHALLARVAAPAAADAAGLPATPALLDRFADVLDGVRSPRLALARALAEPDPPGFFAAFDDLLDARERETTALAPARADDPVFVARRAVFVEGVALLGLAERAGWTADAEYPACPRAARLAPVAVWPPDLFGDVARIAAEQRRRRGLPPQV